MCCAISAKLIIRISDHKIDDALDVINLFIFELLKLVFLETAVNGF